MIEERHCPACGSGRHKSLERIELASQHREYAPQNPGLQAQLTTEAAKSSPSYQMLECEHCRLEFALPMASPSSDWYALAYGALDLYPQMRWEFMACLQSLRPTASVFEFGCGTGTFLNLCRERGMEAVGVDFSKAAVEECSRQGLNAFEFDINEELPSTFRQSASQIVAFHVVEHLEEPQLLFRHARTVARPGAHLWIAVPSDRRSSRRFRKRDFLDQPPHHMSRWTEAAFRETGKREGWQLLRVHYEPIDLRTSVWSIATSSAVYAKAKEWGLTPSSNYERLLRSLLYPYAAFRRLTLDHRLTGFTMLAEFGLREEARR